MLVVEYVLWSVVERRRGRRLSVICDSIERDPNTHKQHGFQTELIDTSCSEWRLAQTFLAAEGISVPGVTRAETCVLALASPEPRPSRCSFEGARACVLY